MRKKMLSLALALVMCLSLVPTALAAETQSPVEKFTDVPANASYYDALEYAVHNGYISGTSATTFSPDTCLTRAQFVTVLGRMMGVSNVFGVTKFTDVPSNAWYAPYVAWAANLGVVSGTSATQFSPDSILTVEQLGTMLARYITLTNAKAEVQKANVQYADKSKIASWAAASMETMRHYGIILPDARGNVNPQSQVKRSDGVVALVAFAKALGMGEEFRKEEEKPVEPPVEEPTEPIEPPLRPINPGVDPIPQGTMLSGTGITAKDLVPASWNNVNQFVWPHDVDDFETACSNIIYMYMHDKSVMEFTMPENYDYESLSWYSSLYNEASWFVFNAFECGGVFRADKTYGQSQGRWQNGVYIPGTYGWTIKVTISLSKGTSRAQTLVQGAVDKACEIHDELWRSGKITASMTQKEKAWAYFAWVTSNVAYDYGDENKNQGYAYGALVDRLAVCEGYTEAYRLLLATEGIECYELSIEGDNHACNIAILDGIVVGIDSTWTDWDIIERAGGMTGDVYITRFAMTMDDLASFYHLPDYLQRILLGGK